MDTGAPRLEETEIYHQRIRMEVLVSRQQLLDHAWKYRLCSPFWRFYANAGSGAHLLIGGKKIRLEPQYVYLIPAWLQFETDTSSPILQNFIHFDFVGFPTSVHKKYFKRILRLRRQGILKDLIDSWSSCIHGPAWGNFARAHALIYSAMAAALEQNPDENRCFDWNRQWGEFQHILDRIDRQPGHSFSNSELARLCNLSASHFIKKFQSAFGMTPGQFRIEKR